MKITKQFQVGTKIVKYTEYIPEAYDEEGNILIEAHEEIREKEVPVYEFKTVDATFEEEKQYKIK